MFRRLLVLLLCLTVSWQAWAAAAWPAGHCMRVDAMATTLDAWAPAVAADAAALQLLLLPQPANAEAADPAMPMPDHGCCAGQDGDSGVGCAGAADCHGVALALAALWPRLNDTVPHQTALPPVALSAAPRPPAVVWRPPIHS